MCCVSTNKPTEVYQSYSWSAPLKTSHINIKYWHIYTEFFYKYIYTSITPFIYSQTRFPTNNEKCKWSNTCKYPDFCKNIWMYLFASGQPGYSKPSPAPFVKSYCTTVTPAGISGVNEPGHSIWPKSTDRGFAPAKQTSCSLRTSCIMAKYN